MDVSRHSFNCLVSVENIGRNMTYTMAAEVGLLTRNIKVIGEPYPDQLSEAFGARMLVGTYQDDRLYIGRLEIRLCICNAILGTIKKYLVSHSFFLKKWVGRADFIFIFYLPNEIEGIKFTD